jgi:hypothetical protein
MTHALSFDPDSPQKAQEAQIKLPFLRILCLFAANRFVIQRTLRRSAEP